QFNSETDSEIIAHLIKRNYENNLLSAVQKTLIEINGFYAINVLCKDEPDKIICAKKGVPLIIGVGNGENFITSDIAAVLNYTNSVIFLEDGDIAEVTSKKIIIKDINNNIRKREIKDIKLNVNQIEKCDYKHFMLKEIFEQSDAVKKTFNDRIFPNNGIVNIDEVNLNDCDVNNISKIYIVACGTSYHAGLISKFLFENFAKINTEVDIASEFRYRNSVLNKRDFVIVISQSGETADTLAALRFAKNKNCKTLAICNSVDSSISRESDYVIYTCCGPEIGVASTKSFTSQLAILYMLAFDWANKGKKITKKELKKYLHELYKIPSKISESLENSELLKNIAKSFANKKNFLYLGRNINYPIALEGALKMKEISYIHAEGCAAGEMKHGTIALVDKTMPIIAVAAKNITYEKIVSNINEVKSRGGIIISLINKRDEKIATKSDYIIYIPDVDEFMSPFVTVIPLQFLAYYIAVFNGCDVDQPRNLAKSVTVE
ncbi:MAG: glutamine--fructose-6-phosphate transaminase (isomerizing), partial [Endomicrobium sp.]|nr:glutamine--fructose-6-phosphate transaminase (isomerizing) [Endomicrobium sp.]